MSRPFFAVAAALLITGCAKSPEDEFIGVWFDVDEEVTVQFFDEGTIVVQEQNDSFSGDYRILDENQLRLDLSESGSEPRTMVFSYELDGDALTLIAPDGDRANLTRVGPGTRELTSPAAMIRAQVTEGLNLSAGAKAAVTEFYFDMGTWPATNAEAGLTDAHEIYTRYVASLAVENGVITITYGNDAHYAIQGKTMLLKPTSNVGSVSWNCSSPSIDPEYLPAVCR